MDNQPTHVAVTVQAWKAALDVLGTLPHTQVENLILQLRNCAPVTVEEGKPTVLKSVPEAAEEG